MDKGQLYDLFANIFAREPTLELLKIFQLGKNKAVLESYGIDPFLDIKNLPLSQQREALAVEYTRLFLLPPIPVPLQESLQLGEERLWGDAAVRVNRIYSKFGFELEEGFKEPPDHLSAEFSFMARLSGLEESFKNGSSAAAREGVLQVKKYFLRNHLLRWFGRLKEALDKHANLCYYKEVARLAGMILDEEREGLKDIREET